MAPLTRANTGVRPTCFKSTLQEVLFVVSATMAVAMTAFLTGSTTVINSFAGKDLNMSQAEITWITASSSLTAGSLLLFFGSIADLFGRKTLFVSSLLLFAIFSLAAGFSQNPITLDVLNGIMGIFSASAVPPAQGMLGVIYEKPSKRKNRVFACFSAGNPLGFVFGTIFSGVATQIFNWRASYWLLAIIYLAVTVLAFFAVPSDQTPKEPLNWESLKRFDLVGTGLTIAGIGMFCAALSLGGDATNGWKTPYVLVLLILGLVLMAAFVVWENKYQYAMLPMNIWRDREFSLLISILLFGFLAFPVMQFWLALYFQRVLHFSSLMTAVHLLPMAIMGILVNVVAALILHKISNKLLMAIGAFAYVLSFVLCAAQRTGDSYWAFSFPALCLAVVGADFEFNVANMYVVSSLPPHRQSIAGSLFQTITRLCTTIGLGIATAIYNAVEQNPSKSGYYTNNPVEPYAATWWFCAGVSAVALALVPFLRIGTQGQEKKVEEVEEEDRREEEEAEIEGGDEEKGGERLRRSAEVVYNQTVREEGRDDRIGDGGEKKEMDIV